MVRRTAQREAIRRVLQRNDRPLSPPEILELAKREVPQLGLTTVYRALNALVDEGWLAAVQLPGEAMRYEVTSRPPHDFFRCTNCGRVDTIPQQDLNLDGLPEGYVVEQRILLLMGRCADCAETVHRDRGVHPNGGGHKRDVGGRGAEAHEE